jgi:hypothetical protein
MDTVNNTTEIDNQKTREFIECLKLSLIDDLKKLKPIHQLEVLNHVRNSLSIILKEEVQRLNQQVYELEDIINQFDLT